MGYNTYNTMYTPYLFHKLYLMTCMCWFMLLSKYSVGTVSRFYKQITRILIPGFNISSKLKQLIYIKYSNVKI